MAVKYKLRIYYLSGINKGNLDHEEFFASKEDMNARYDELFQKDNYGYNPTAWKLNNPNSWSRLEGY